MLDRFWKTFWYSGILKTRMCQLRCLRRHARHCQPLRHVRFDRQLLDRCRVRPAHAIEHLGYARSILVRSVHLGWIGSRGHCNWRANGWKLAWYCAALNLSPSTKETSSDSCGETWERPDSDLMGNHLQERVQSQRCDISGPVGPNTFPGFGGRCHSSAVVRFIRSTEVTLVHCSFEGW